MHKIAFEKPTIAASGPRRLRAVSLFTGVGGLDLGLERAGHQTVEMCENWAPARRVLEARFPTIPAAVDVRDFAPGSEFDLLAAGFPCVDLSHAGRQRGIFGPQSGLVDEAFRVVEAAQPEFVLLENVVNLLRLGRGAGIAHIIDSLERLGYAWAYRVVDSRSGGVPQARRRVLVLASRTRRPEDYLLAQDADEASPTVVNAGAAHGFYWTEGRRGVGLVENAVPTLKGGSTIGLPSAPAIWDPTAAVGRQVTLPTIEDGEALQGLPRRWTEPATVAGEHDSRWKLVGNAVTVGVGSWIGDRLADTRVDGMHADDGEKAHLDRSRPWPDAAWGGPGVTARRSNVSHFPVRPTVPALASMVSTATATPLSYRATAGFMSRVENSGVRVAPALAAALRNHLDAMRPAAAVR